MIGRRSTAQGTVAERESVDPTSEAAPEPASPARYEGGLQGVGNGQVIGWAWSPTNPSARIRVKIVLDGEIVAEGTAELERPDLAVAGKSDGACGFVIDLPTSAATTAHHRILALAGPELVALDPSPSFWHEASPQSRWSGVAFEPGGQLGAQVAAPPIQAPRRAILARGGWLFDAEDFKLPARPAVAEIDELARRIEATADALSALGIHYLPAVIAPKALACSELLGESPPTAGRSWLRELRMRLHDSDRAELFSLVPALRDAGRQATCYHRTDADWNDAGAFFAARALAKELAKRIPALCPPRAEELHLRAVPDYRGSLADAAMHELIDGALVPVRAQVERESGFALERHSMRALRMPLDQHLAGAGGVHTRLFAQADGVRRPGSEGIRLAVVGGGAALGPLAWLAECAERTTFWWSLTLPRDPLELELPHAVVHLIRMRELPALLQTDYGLDG